MLNSAAAVCAQWVKPVCLCTQKVMGLDPILGRTSYISIGPLSKTFELFPQNAAYTPQRKAKPEM